MRLRRPLRILLVLFLGVAMLPAAEDPADASLVYQLNEREVTIKKSGHKTVRVHKVIRIQKRDAIEYIGDISVNYNAYYKKAKLLHAFTQTADGRKSHVRKDAVHDTMPQNFEAYRMYSDVRTLTFSMPALQVGAVIDYAVEISDRRPIIDGHAWDLQYLDETEPVEVSRYTLTYPKSMDLKISARNVTGAPTTNVHFWSQTLSWTLESLAPMRYEPGMPPYHDVRRLVQVSSVPSWEFVGEWFRDLLKGKPDISDAIRKRAKELTQGKRTDAEKIRAIYGYLQKDVRYVGVELGRSAYMPHPAEDCFKNRYGDCKDQSVLLVGMLRHVGIKAHLALMRPNFFGGLVTEVPSPGQFNHAIVHVPAADGPLWLDPTTRYFDEKSYPAALDDTQALVIEPEKPVFVHIPSLAPEYNIERTIHDVKLLHNGVCRVKETMEMVGRAGAAERVSFETVEDKDRKKTLEAYMDRKPGHARLIDFGNTNPHDLSQPFRTWVTYETERFLAPSRAGYSLSLTANSIQWPLRVGGRRMADDDDEPRQHDWYRRSGNQLEIICRIQAPRGFALAGEAESYEARLPQGEVTLDVVPGKKQVEARARVIGRPCRIAAEEWRSVRNQAERKLSRAAVSLVLEDQILKRLAEKKPAAAITLLESWIKADPTNANLHHRLGKVLHRCGRISAARKAFRTALKHDPSVVALYLDLAETHGGYLGTYSRGFDRDSAAAVLREGIKQVADKRRMRMALASLYERNDDGFPQGYGAPLDKAAELYREILKEKKDHVQTLVALGSCLFEMGKYKEAEQTFSQACEQDSTNLSALAGRWEATAFLGETDQAIDAVRGYYHLNADRATELLRLGNRLLTHRFYKEAAVMIEYANALSPARSQGKDLPVLLRRMAKRKQYDYSSLTNLSTPRDTVTTYMAAAYYGDTERLVRAHSRRIGFTTQDAELAINVLRGGFASMTVMRDFVIDLLAWEWKAAERTLPGGDIELKLTPPKEANTAATGRQMITCQLTREDGEWRACGVGFQGTVAGFSGKMAASYVDEGDFTKAGYYVDRIAARMSGFYMGRPREGSALFAQVEAEDYPDKKSRILALTGLSLTGAEDMTRAVVYLEQAVAVVPDSRILKRLLGGVLSEREDYERSAKLFEELVESRPGDRESMRALVDVLTRLQRYDEALETVDRLLDLSPSDLMVRSAKSDIYEKSGDYDKALREFKICSVGLPPALAVPQEAVLRAMRGEKDAVRKLAEKAVTGNASARTHRPLYGAYLLLEDADAAMEQAECVLLANPGSIEGMLMLGRMTAERGDTDETRLLAHRVKQAPLKAGESVFRMASLLHMLGEYDEALEVYESLPPGEKPSLAVYGHLCMAVCHLVKGNKAAAEAASQAAEKEQTTKLWPEPVIQYYTGKLSFDELLALARKEKVAIRNGQYVCEAYYYGAMRALANGQRKEAMNMLAQAVDTRSFLTTEYVLAKSHLARLQASQE